MEFIILNPGLQHITEMILMNLDFEDLQTCQLLNKSCINDVLSNTMFWLKKWREQRGLSNENYCNWVKAIQLTKNTNVEANVKWYLEKVIKNGYVVDVPCFIDSDAVKKSSEFTFQRALKENVPCFIDSVKKSFDFEFTFQRALQEKDLGILQILASNKNHNKGPLYFAAQRGHIDILKVLAPITKISNGGEKLIYMANFFGHYEFARVLQSYINTGHF